MQRNLVYGVMRSVPKVPYKETITGNGKGDFKHKNQTAPRPVRPVVWMSNLWLKFSGIDF
jgi:hypothetical protein